MSHARSQHPKAPLTPEGRRRMVACVLDLGWTIDGFRTGAQAHGLRSDRHASSGTSRLTDQVSPAHAAAPPLQRRSLSLTYVRIERLW